MSNEQQDKAPPALGVASGSATLSRRSLGGQNSHRRVSGARSSRAASTIFKQLRHADRRIAELDRWIKLAWDYSCMKKFEAQRERWDAKREQMRAKRKGYLPNGRDEPRAGSAVTPKK